jgi:hypothetical protein
MEPSDAQRQRMHAIDVTELLIATSQQQQQQQQQQSGSTTCYSALYHMILKQINTLITKHARYCWLVLSIFTLICGANDTILLVLCTIIVGSIAKAIRKC